MGRGLPPAPAIKMTQHQLSFYSETSRKHKTSQQQIKRIQILLLAWQGFSNSAVKRELGISVNTVKLWRKKWNASYSELVDLERSVELEQTDRKELDRRLLSFLEDAYRSGAPKVITLAQEQQVIALTCKAPCDHQIEMTDWSHAMLAKVAVADRNIGCFRK